MAFPARFAMVKPRVEAYEQRLKGAERYSEETISSLLEKAAMDVEGSDVVVVQEEVQAAAAALEDFIYDRAGGEEKAEEKIGEAEEKAEGKVEEAEEKTEEKTGESPVENGQGEAGEKDAAEPKAETQEGEDQEMKEGPADA